MALQADFSKVLTLDFSGGVSDGIFFTKDAFKAVQNNGSGTKKAIQSLAHFQPEPDKIKTYPILWRFVPLGEGEPGHLSRGTNLHTQVPVYCATILVDW
jgi:hypothetical protein